MKYLALLLFILLSAISLKGQVITSTPLFPTENDSIVIVFDAAQATNTSLVGYTGDLYTHTGVNTNLGNWQHVIGNWGNNTLQPQLTRIGTNLYKLAIGFPRGFYSVTNPSEYITSLNFVFRSSNASLQTEDIFLPIFEEGLNVAILQPSLPVSIVEINEPLNIKAASLLADTLFLFFNDSLLAQTTEDSLSHIFVSTDIRAGYIIAKAVDTQSNAVWDTVKYIVRGDVQIADLPAGIITGINYTSDNTATLALFAPLKEFVYVIGNFNNWEIEPDYYMKRTPNDSTYWLEISGLTSGEEYAFQYVVDGEFAIADPYTEKILDPWHDQFISNQTYPDLKEYPHGKTTEAVSILQTARQPYNWQITDFERPAVTDLVIYELLIRDFLADHDYQTLIDTLDYLDNLGINVIELMPVSEFDGNVGWGYDASFLFALDKYYGTREKFKEFIDECHSRGIAVIMDVVLNHATGQSPFVRLYNEGGHGRPTLDNPWLNQTARHPFNVHYDFNHESPQTKVLVDRFNKFWLKEFNIDGFRYDLSKGFTQTNSGGDVGLWGQYDQSRIDILTRMADEIREYDSTAYLILEHFAENSEEIVLANYGFLIWGNRVDQYNEATMGYHDNNKSDLTWGSYQARGWNDPHLVTYMESHDEERLMYKNLQYGNSSGSYDVRNLVTALNRMKLACAFFYTIPGPKMIWKFGELGYDFSINWPSGTSDDRLTPKPIRWDYFQDFDRYNLYRVNQELIKLKKNYDVFRTENFSLAVSGAVKRILLFDDSINVVIIGNFDVVSKSIIPNFSSTGIWYDFFLNDSIDVTNPSAFIMLEPGEFKLYSNVKLPGPTENLLVDIKETNETPTEFRLEQNYPNPFNPSTKISYSLPRAGKVALKVYNVIGRNVATLFSGEQSAGSYQVNFNSSDFNLSSGVYFYQISVGEFIQTKKMVLLK